jgi:hypothetical protein
MSDEKKRFVLTGCWEQNGQYGPFFTGNIKKSEILAKLADLPEDIQVLVSQVTEKKTEQHPDILVSFAENTFKKKQA